MVVKWVSWFNGIKAVEEATKVATAMKVAIVLIIVADLMIAMVMMAVSKVF